jgi:ribosome-associated toxin RatA of RatAB toxin-antitoxin module
MIRSRFLEGMLIFCLVFCNNALFAFEWEFSKEVDGIQIYTKATDNSKIAEFKGVTIVDSRIEVMGMVLRDIPAYPQWMSGCMESRIIEKFDENNLITYYTQETPWLVQNRDVVIKATTQINWDKGLVVVNIQSIEDSRMPPTEKFVRMNEMRGEWRLEYIDRKHTKVTFILKLDPAGAIPSFLVNSGNNNFQYHTLLNLKQMVKQRKYLDAANQSKDKEMIEKYFHQWRSVK